MSEAGSSTSDVIEFNEALARRRAGADLETLIATMSAGLTLQPGDIIAIGTPKGVGIGFDPPRFLRSGVAVAVEISELGPLSNQFV